MTDLKASELKLFNLADVPSGLEWCIYPEERESGEVFLPKTVYLLVLVLRWILTYTDTGFEEGFETWKVYWRSEGAFDFRTRIYLSRERVEQYDILRDEHQVLQSQTWAVLAVLSSSSAGVIRDVYIPATQLCSEGPWHLNGVAGVQRLLEDAIRTSRATHHWQPIRRLRNGWTGTWRVDDSQEAGGWGLDFRLLASPEYVAGISLKLRKPFDY